MEWLKKNVVALVGAVVLTTGTAAAYGEQRGAVSELRRDVDELADRVSTDHDCAIHLRSEMEAVQGRSTELLSVVKELVALTTELRLVVTRLEVTVERLGQQE